MIEYSVVISYDGRSRRCSGRGIALSSKGWHLDATEVTLLNLTFYLSSLASLGQSIKHRIC